MLIHGILLPFRGLYCTWKARPDLVNARHRLEPLTYRHFAKITRVRTRVFDFVDRAFEGLWIFRDPESMIFKGSPSEIQRPDQDSNPAHQRLVKIAKFHQVFLLTEGEHRFAKILTRFSRAMGSIPFRGYASFSSGVFDELGPWNFCREHICRGEQQ